MATAAWCLLRAPCASWKRRPSTRSSRRASSSSPAAVAAYRSIEEQPGIYRGVEAVVDKDFASGFLAAHLGASVFVVSTGVEKVAIRFRSPDQRFLDRLTLSEARGYLAAGEFPEGSMGPKIRAAMEFIERGGRGPSSHRPIISRTPWPAARARTWSPTERGYQSRRQRHPDAGARSSTPTCSGPARPSCARPGPSPPTGSGPSAIGIPP